MEVTRNNSGATLVEVLFATVIILFVSAATIGFYISVLNLSETNREEAIALTHLSNMMEAIKCTPFSAITADFPDGFSDSAAVNRYAAIVGEYALREERLAVSYIDTQSDPLEITIEVSWQGKRGADRTNYLVTKRTR